LLESLKIKNCNTHALIIIITLYVLSVLQLTANNEDEPVFEINVIVDPVSRGAQKVGSIISVLSQVINANINVYLNCVSKNSDMPVKRYLIYLIYILMLINY